MAENCPSLVQLGNMYWFFQQSLVKLYLFQQSSQLWLGVEESVWDLGYVMMIISHEIYLSKQDGAFWIEAFIKTNHKDVTCRMVTSVQNIPRHPIPPEI